MKRRDLLTSALAVAAGGCAAQRIGSGTGSIDGALGNLDRTLGRISDPFGGFVQRETGSDLIIPERERALINKSLESMLVFGTMHDLAREERSHPQMRSRLAAIVPGGARSLYGITAHLEQIAPAERILMQRHLAADPSLPLRTAEHLDRLAGSAQLGSTSRVKLRSLATDTAWRLGHQPVSLFLDETTERVHKAAHRAGEWSKNDRMALAALMQEEGEWEEDVEYEEYEETEELEEPQQTRPRERRPWRGRGMAIAGGAAGVLGLVGGYASLIWAYGNSIGNNSQTGAIVLAAVSGFTFVAGVIVMIVGLVIKGREDAEWLERNPKPKRRRRR